MVVVDRDFFFLLFVEKKTHQKNKNKIKQQQQQFSCQIKPKDYSNFNLSADCCLQVPNKRSIPLVLYISSLNKEYFII